MSEVGEPQFGRLVGEWHRWFAWYPVKTFDQRSVWFRFVWRRSVYKHQYLEGGPDWWWWYSLTEPAK